LSGLLIVFKSKRLRFEATNASKFMGLPMKKTLTAAFAAILISSISGSAIAHSGATGIVKNAWSL
jgi:hypothetical protein